MKSQVLRRKIFVFLLMLFFGILNTSPAFSAKSNPHKKNPTTAVLQEPTPEPIPAPTPEPTPIPDPAPTATTPTLSDGERVDAAAAILAAAGTLRPVEGTNTNVIPMAQAIVDAQLSGVTVSIYSTSNSQIAQNGAITYSAAAVTGSVIFRLTGRSEYTGVIVPIAVPAKAVTTTSTTTSAPVLSTIIAPLPVTTTTVSNYDINVRDFGAKGDGVSNDTQAIQNAINSIASGVVFIPDGVYMIDALTHIRLHSNIKLVMSEAATLRAIPNASENYAVIWACNISDIEITGGNIVGDRFAHQGSSGQWGMGIDAEGCNNILISDINITDCWGDGIYIGSSYAQNYCQGVLIQGVLADHNRRNGITVISAKDLTIRDCVVSNTNGTLPASGIDLEPNSRAEFMQNVLIENVQSANNGIAGSEFGGWALDVWFGAGTNDACLVPFSNVSVIVKNVTDSGSYRGTLASNFRDYIACGYNISLQ